MTKCEKLAQCLPDSVDCVIIQTAANRRYFTDFSSSDGILIISREYAVFGIDGRYIEAARNRIQDANVVLVQSYNSFVKEILSNLGAKTAAVEGESTLFELGVLKNICPDIDFFSNKDVNSAIRKLRMVKSGDEIRKIAEAQRLTDIAFTHIINYIRAGVTERDIALELEFFMKKQGAEKESFDTIAVSGKRTSMPHGVPTEKEVEKGDFITMDFGAVVDGYHSDMTRTVAVGSVDDEMKKVYNLVLESQVEGLNSLQPGVECKSVDKICRDIINKAGYGEYFTHSTGHGVGLDIHEYPNLSMMSMATLEKGNVVTVEPGIYIPEKFGVRIEDFVVITSYGYHNFTESPKELMIL